MEVVCRARAPFVAPTIVGARGFDGAKKGLK